MSMKENAYRPTITDMISLQIPGEVKVSPDGRRVAYAVRTTHWNENRYERLCYVHDIVAARSFQITRSGNVNQIEWIDCDSLAVSKSEGDEEAQIWIFEHLMGEGVQVTDHKGGVQFFKPFAGGILFLADHPERKEKKSRAEQFGTFNHFEQETSASALYYAGLHPLRVYQEQLKNRTADEADKLTKPVVELSKRLAERVKIVDFVVSPMNNAVYVNCRSRDDLVYREDTSHYRFKLDPDQALKAYLDEERSKKKEEPEQMPDSGAPDEAEDLSYLGQLTRIALPKGAAIVAVSPDGSKLLVSHQARDIMYYTQPDLWILDVAETEDVLSGEHLVERLHNITANLDQEVLVARWVKGGIFTGYVSGTRSEIARLTEAGEIEVLDFPEELPGFRPSWQFDASEDGVLGFVGTSKTMFPEVCIASSNDGTSAWKLQPLTSLGEQVAGWDLGTVETIRWTSKDGTEIEGVLRKPSDFAPNQKYPLLLVVHGGPIWFSPAILLDIDELAYYPSVQFNHRGMLVLKPNYRGSVGRGQAFRELNKDNLGIGDLEDLESAIDYLASQGLIDPSRVGCMGWSQGGYISAFATIHSDKFRAVSVGAGVADWYTYHITNDIPQFTTHYLSGTPFRNREAYIRTAPMGRLQEAKTPTMIQHGAKDQRVPLANATELYRGLQDMGVPVELFVYPEMAHPITKPRENRAVMWQNLTWFTHHLQGEKLDFFQIDNA